MAKGTTEKIYTEWLVLRCQDCDKTAFYELYKLWAIRFETYVRKLSRSGDCTASAKRSMVAGSFRS